MDVIFIDFVKVFNAESHRQSMAQFTARCGEIDFYKRCVHSSRSESDSYGFTTLIFTIQDVVLFTTGVYSWTLVVCCLY